MFIKFLTLIMQFNAPGSRFQAIGLGQYGHIVEMYYILGNHFLYSHISLRKNYLHGCDVQEAFYQNSEIMSLESGVEADIWLYSETYFKT